MKAMICRSWGEPEDLAFEEIEPAPLKAGQVRIEVHAAGVSFATTLVIAGKYQRRPPFPFAPGTEVAGTVVEVDPACRRLKVGDEVVAVLDWGGLAEQAVAHEVNVFPKPRNVGFVEAIQLAISYPTSAGALTWPAVLDVQKGHTLLVHAAAGGVGMAAVEIGKILGATGIATAGGPRKVEFVRTRGADHVIDYTASDFRDEVLKLTGGRGVDRVYDPVGGDVFAQSLRCMAVESRICPIGFAGGTIPQIPANILLVKNVTVIGFYYGYYNGWGGKAPPTPKEAAGLAKRRAMVAEAQEELMRWFTEDKLKATVAGAYDLADWVDAFRLIEQRTVVGKAVLVA